MRALLVLAVVAACLRVAWPLTEGAANCPVAGNWSDAEGTKMLRVWRSVQGNSSVQGNTSGLIPLQPSLTTNLELNTSGYRFVHEGWNATTPQTIFNSTAFLVVLANVTGPNGYSSTDRTIVELLCSNDILFVDIYPASDMAVEETSFPLRRRVAPPLSEEPPILSSSPSSPSSPGISPQFILVNISLPHRQQDDRQEHVEYASRKQAEAPRDVPVTGQGECPCKDACCACQGAFECEPSCDDPAST